MTFRALAVGIGVICLQLSLTCTVFAADTVKPNAQGIIQLVGKTGDGRDLHIRITLRHTNSTDRHEARVQESNNTGVDWWGGGEGAPDHIISTFEVAIGKDYIPLSRSAYIDLAEVKEAQVATTKSGFAITIYGGETGTGYSARLRFQGAYLVEREVTHNEMGLEEKTEYFPIKDN